MSDFARCPCCGYPTLNARGEYELCPICWWEDESTALDAAPDTESAANGGYTLTRARANVADHFDMYDPGAGIGVVANPSPTRKALLAYLAASESGERDYDFRILHGLLRSDAAARHKDMP